MVGLGRLQKLVCQWALGSAPRGHKPFLGPPRGGGGGGGVGTLATPPPPGGGGGGAGVGTLATPPPRGVPEFKVSLNARIYIVFFAPQPGKACMFFDFVFAC